MPRFHHHVKSWCAENIHLRKKVPFLVFEKPHIKIESSVDAHNGSTAVTNLTSISNIETKTTVYPSKNSRSKNLRRDGGRVHRAAAADVSTAVDNEAPLLDLAHRIPMRQVSLISRMSTQSISHVMSCHVMWTQDMHDSFYTSIGMRHSLTDAQLDQQRVPLTHHHLQRLTPIIGSFKLSSTCFSGFCADLGSNNVPW